jgi:hypothetical protein
VRRERELSCARRWARRRAAPARKLLVQHLVLALGGALLGVAIAAVARGGLADTPAAPRCAPTRSR